MSNNVQLIFHVPMYRYDGKHLVDINYQDFRRGLIEILLVVCSSDFETALVQSYVDLLIPKYQDEKSLSIFDEFLPWSESLPSNIRKPKK